MNMRTFAAALLIVPSIANGAAAAPKTETRTMSFAQCLEQIRKASSQYAVAPINIVETNTVRMVRFVLKDGSVLITCSAADNKMAITLSD